MAKENFSREVSLLPQTYILNFDKLVFQRICLMMFKHHIGGVPKPISDLFQIGYEPAGLTVHPPPPKMIEGGFIFFVWVSSVTKIFSSK